MLLRAASVGRSGSSSLSKPVFLSTLLAGPAGVHGPGSARALPRVGPARRRKHPEDAAKLEEKGMGEGGWE